MCAEENPKLPNELQSQARPECIKIIYVYVC